MLLKDLFEEKKAPKIKPFPTGAKWKELLSANLVKWEKLPNFSDSWYDSVSGPRKVTYSTGRDSGGYRSGMEGTYRALKIDKTDKGHKVTFFSPVYGIQDDTYNEGVKKQRKGAGFKVGTWPVTAEQAYQALQWQKKAGLFDYE